MAKIQPYVGLYVTINGRPADKSWFRFKLIMEHSKHTVGQLTMRHYLGSNSRLSGRSYYKKRSRIAVRFGEAPTRGLSNTFRGYITNHTAGKTKKDSNGRYVEVTYYLVGTSDPLQKKHNWRGSSWSSAARTIAKRHKMKAVVHTTPRLSKPIVQTTSDFKFLVAGAEKTGYRFFVHGATLYFINPKKILNTRTSGTPWFQGDAIRSLEVEETENEDTVYIVSGTADDGSPVLATNANGDVELDIQETVLEYMDMEAVISPEAESSNVDVDSSSEVMFEVSADDQSPPSIVYDQSVVESLAEAEAAIEARVLSDKLWVTAKVEAQGDARVTPARVVYLSGSDITPEHRGLWLVNKVVHNLDISKNQDPLQAYTVKMDLGRDQARTIDLPNEDAMGYDDPGTNINWDITEEWAEETTVSGDEVVDVGGVWQAEYYATPEEVEDAFA